MLFIDNNNSRVFQRCKHCRSGAENNRRVRRCCLSPRFETLLICETGVEHGHLDIKTVAKTFFGLRGQADFWNQYQSLTTVADNFFDALQIDFSLATTGDTVD